MCCLLLQPWERTSRASSVTSETTYQTVIDPMLTSANGMTVSPVKLTAVHADEGAAAAAVATANTGQPSPTANTGQPSSGVGNGEGSSSLKAPQGLNPAAPVFSLRAAEASGKEGAAYDPFTVVDTYETTKAAGPAGTAQQEATIMNADFDRSVMQFGTLPADYSSSSSLQQSVMTAMADGTEAVTTSTTSTTVHAASAEAAVNALAAGTAGTAGVQHKYDISGLLGTATSSASSAGGWKPPPPPAATVRKVTKEVKQVVAVTTASPSPATAAVDVPARSATAADEPRMSKQQPSTEFPSANGGAALPVQPHDNTMADRDVALLASDYHSAINRSRINGDLGNGMAAVTGSVGHSHSPISKPVVEYVSSAEAQVMEEQPSTADGAATGHD